MLFLDGTRSINRLEAPLRAGVSSIDATATVIDSTDVDKIVPQFLRQVVLSSDHYHCDFEVVLKMKIQILASFV